jgi:hypothetical protein
MIPRKQLLLEDIEKEKAREHFKNGDNSRVPGRCLGQTDKGETVIKHTIGERNIENIFPDLLILKLTP